MSIDRLKRACALLLAVSLFAAPRAQAQDSTSRKWPDKFMIHWNEYNLGFTTIVVGAGFLVDYATYNQDSASAARFDLERQGKIRDDRFLINGVFRTSRPMTWQTGLFYDVYASKWRVRQTI